MAGTSVEYDIPFFYHPALSLSCCRARYVYSGMGASVCVCVCVWQVRVSKPDFQCVCVCVCLAPPSIPPTLLPHYRLADASINITPRHCPPHVGTMLVFSGSVLVFCGASSAFPSNCSGTTRRVFEYNLIDQHALYIGTMGEIHLPHRLVFGYYCCSEL